MSNVHAEEAVPTAVVTVVGGIALSGVGLLIAAMFSMGMALGEPAVVLAILVAGPAISFASLQIIRFAKSRRARQTSPNASNVSGHSTSPLLSMFLLACGASVSLSLFVEIMRVESHFPGQLQYDVFGPYYTHPHRPLAGIILSIVGLVLSVVSYAILRRPSFSFGLAFGSVALALVLFFAK